MLLFVMCAMSKIYEQLGKLHTNDVWKNFSVDQSYHSEHKSNRILKQRKIRRRSINLAREYSKVNLWATLLWRMDLERRLTRCTRWWIAGERRGRSLCKKSQNKRSPCVERRRQFHFSLCNRICKAREGSEVWPSDWIYRDIEERD